MSLFDGVCPSPEIKKQKNYGIPYMGSKSKIVDKVCALFPNADHFYDLFGGGFSVTHYLLMHRPYDFKYFHFNDIRSGICDLVKRGIEGEFNYNTYKPKFVTREDFFANKDSDPEIKMLWSFGNNARTYLFGKDIEPYKKSLHHCVVFGEFDEISRAASGLRKWPKELSGIKERRLFVRRNIEHYRKENLLPDILHQFLKKKQREEMKQLRSLQQLQQLERLEQLQQLERLEQLQRLERLERLERLSFYSLDYRSVKLKKNSIIYCDIPYNGTAKYDEFNHDEFFDWAAKCEHPIYISEYKIDDKRFKLIYEIEKKCNLSGTGPTNSVERVYSNKAAHVR